MMKIFALGLILCGFLTFQVAAQTILENNKVPDDLLIILKNRGSWGGGLSEITITANGDWSQKTSGGLPLAAVDGLTLKEQPIKSPEYLKPKLSAQKLKLLIAEFEKIEFFRFGNNYPLEDEKETTSISDAGTEVISIRINGQTKEVSNYLGDFTKRRRLLAGLAEKIRGAGIWNFENGEIPQDLSISYTNNFGWGAFSQSIITADGRVRGKFVSNMPSNPTVNYSLRSKVKTKPVKLKDKISQDDLKQLIAEFEKIGFSAAGNLAFNSQNGCTNENLTTDGKSTHISIQINGRALSASVYEGCQPKAGSDAAKFELIIARIEKLLKNVKSVK